VHREFFYLAVSLQLHMAMPIEHIGKRFTLLSTTVTYERCLQDAVLQAAGGGNFTWIQASDGLCVVSVGIFSNTDRQACACGQSPWQQVLQYRHEATGKPLNIGFSCVKRFRMLGDTVCYLLLAARCLLPLQRLVCEITEEVKPEKKFLSLVMSGTVWNRLLAVQRLCDACSRQVF
jgi:hypothetical protein